MTVFEFPPERLAVRLAANSLVQAAGSFLAAAIAFFTFVAVTRGLGPDAYGHITAATAFLFIPAVLSEAGLSAALLRQISAAPERTEHAIGASVPLRTGISAVAVGAAVLVGLVSPLPELTKVAIVISSLGTLCTLLTLIVIPVLQAQLKMHWSVAATLAGRLLTLGLTLGALAAGYGFRSVLAAQVAGLALILCLHVLVVARLVRLRPRVDVAYWRQLVGASLALGLAIALGQVYFRVDALILALLRSPYEVGLYGAAYKFIELSDLVVVAVATSIFPPLARFVATGDPRTRGLVQRSFDVLLAAAAPLAVGMVVFAVPIVLATAGPEFREGAVALRLLGPYVLFSFLNGLFFRILMAFGRDRLLLSVASGVLTGNVALNVVFIPLYGFRAAAAISVISEAAVLGPLALAVRRRGFAPRLSYVPAVGAAALAMAAIALVLPGPTLAVAAAAAAGYAAVILALPGTARDVIFGNLVPALVRAAGRAR